MLILYEGVPIYTLWDRSPRAEALVVRDGVICAVGSRREMIAQFPGAKRMAIEGGALVPAFNDAHCHILSTGLDLTKANLRDCRALAEIQATLQSWNEEKINEGWILGVGYDHNLLPNACHISRYDLDEVAPGRPIFLRHSSGHCAVVNSKALDLSGVTSQTPDPMGGLILRDEGGEPTGVLLELNAIELVEKNLPPPTLDEMTSAILKAADRMARMGILSASDAWTGKLSGLEAEWQAYAKALERGAPVHVTLMPDYKQATDAGWLNRDAMIPPAHHPNLRVGAIKLFLDGAITPRTAALKKPYEDGSVTPVMVYPSEEFMEMVITAHLGGWQLAVHAIGDKAVELVIQAYSRAQEVMPRPNARHRIEHCTVVSDEMIKQMAQLGIVVVTQPEFIHYWDHGIVSALGERSKRCMPFRSWVEAGVVVGFGSDQPVVPGDPVIGWREAVTRMHRAGLVVGSEERLDPLTALKCFTIGSSYAIFDQSVGCLAPGKRSDFIVLSHLPEEIAEADMKVLASSCFLMPGN
jgi:predicted amidohydrolase YtcJ